MLHVSQGKVQHETWTKSYLFHFVHVHTRSHLFNDFFLFSVNTESWIQKSNISKSSSQIPWKPLKGFIIWLPCTFLTAPLCTGLRKKKKVGWTAPDFQFRTTLRCGRDVGSSFCLGFYCQIHGWLVGWLVGWWSKGFQLSWICQPLNAQSHLLHIG